MHDEMVGLAPLVPPYVEPTETKILRAVLYTRNGCHLCETARHVLERHGLAPIEVDIDADPALRERFNTCVPVVELDGKVRFRGRIDEVLLRRILTAAGN